MIKKNNKNDNSGSFIGHLTDRRSRLFKSFIFLIFLSIPFFIGNSDVLPHNAYRIELKVNRMFCFIKYILILFFSYLFF